MAILALFLHPFHNDPPEIQIHSIYVFHAPKNPLRKLRSLFLAGIVLSETMPVLWGQRIPFLQPTHLLINSFQHHAGNDDKSTGP